jgi:hypothetical protein
VKVKILVWIFCLVALISCRRNNKDGLLLQIGDHRLTIPDYELKRKSDKYKSLTDQQLQNKLIEEGRIIAFSFDHKYDTITALNKHLEYAMRFYASKVDGFVWNKKVKPKLELTDSEIHQAYLKRSQDYTLEVIHIPSKSILDKYQKPGDSLESESEFNLLKKNVASDPNVSVSTSNARYPFYPIGIYTDKIYIAKAGDVLGPIEALDGYYIIRIAGTKKATQNDYRKEKALIKQELLSGLTQKYIFESQQEIFGKANVRMNDAAIEELASKFNDKEKKWPEVNPRLILMDYNFEGKRARYYAADFFEFVANQPVFFGSLSKPADVRKMLSSNIIGKALYAEAQRMNMESDEEYLQFKKHYQEKVFLEYYKRQHVYHKLSVQRAELETYYHQHRHEFKGFESATVSIYKFPDIQKAFEGQMQISNPVKISVLSGNSASGRAARIPKTGVVDINLNNPNTDPTVVAEIFKLNPGQVSSPIEANGEYLIFSLVSKKGTITLPYQYVKENIRKLLYAQKEIHINARQTEELKAKYPIEENRMAEYIANQNTE